MSPDKPRRQQRVQGGSRSRINVRVTPSVYDELKWRAKLAGLSLPRYLVECGLRRHSGWSLLEQRFWTTEWEAVRSKLGRSGGALNQLAARTNSGQAVTDQQLAAALDYHTAAVNELREVLNAVDPRRSPTGQ